MSLGLNIYGFKYKSPISCRPCAPEPSMPTSVAAYSLRVRHHTLPVASTEPGFSQPTVTAALPLPPLRALRSALRRRSSASPPPSAKKPCGAIGLGVGLGVGLGLELGPGSGSGLGLGFGPHRPHGEAAERECRREVRNPLPKDVRGHRERYGEREADRGEQR